MREMRGKPLAQALRRWCRDAVAVGTASGNRGPSLAILQVGEDPASTAYRRQKTLAVEEMGGRVLPGLLPSDASLEEARRIVCQWGEDPGIDGIFLEHPLPHGWETALRSLCPPLKDVEGLHPENIGRMYLGLDDTPWPCTAEAAVLLPEWYGFGTWEGKEAVVIGRSLSVGRAVALLLQHRHATVTVLHSKSRDMRAHLARAEVLVVAAGVPGIVRGGDVRPGSVVVDVGTNVLKDGTLVGDVDWSSGEGVPLARTPVPGGIGPVTVGLLLRNLTMAWRAPESGGEGRPSLETLRRYEAS